MGYQVTFENIEEVRLVYRLLRTLSGWRVSDIVYPTGELLEGAALEVTGPLR